jgi:hypothetical protein
VQQVVNIVCAGVQILGLAVLQTNSSKLAAFFSSGPRHCSSIELALLGRPVPSMALMGRASLVSTLS